MVNGAPGPGAAQGGSPGAGAAAAPLVLTEGDVTRLCSLEDAASAVSEALADLVRERGGIMPRRRLRNGDGVTLHAMSGWQAGAGFAVKAYTTAEGRMPQAYVLHFDEAGRLCALMEADDLGRLRTGAATLLATRLLAREDARVAALLGAGFQAPFQLQAMLCARPLEEVRVWSRRPERAESLCRELQGETRARLVPAASVAEAVRGADIVTTATAAGEPVLFAEHLEPGMHVNAMGSNRAAARELSADAVARASRVVVDSLEEARLESGDLLLAERDGRFRWSGVAELGDVILGRAPGRTSPDEVTLFESQGVPIEDVAVARLAFLRAREAGIGGGMLEFETQ